MQKQPKPNEPRTPDPQYTTHDVAALLQVDPSTVSKWIDRGALPAFRTPGGHRRVRKAELVAFLELHQIPVPAELGGDDALTPVDADACEHPAIKPEGEAHIVSGARMGRCVACKHLFRLLPLAENARREK